MNQAQFQTIAHTIFRRKFPVNYDPEKVYWEFADGYGYFAKYGVWKYDVGLDESFVIGQTYTTDIKEELNIFYKKGRLRIFNSAFFPYSTWSDENETEQT